MPKCWLKKEGNLKTCPGVQKPKLLILDILLFCDLTPQVNDITLVKLRISSVVNPQFSEHMCYSSCMQIPLLDVFGKAIGPIVGTSNSIDIHGHF